MLKPPDEPIRVIDCPVIGNYRIVGYRAWHLKPFLLVIGNVSSAVRDL